MTGPQLHVEDYDAEWPRQFEREQRQPKWFLGPLAVRIKHVGSAAEPGFAAKPVIDIQIAMAQLDRRRPVFDVLAMRGQVHLPFGPRGDRYPFFQRPARRPTQFQVHLCLAGSD